MSNTASQELVALVHDIREALWPGGDLDASWSGDTFEAICLAFEMYRPDLIPADYYERPPYNNTESGQEYGSGPEFQ
jgi:hypothetical protein